MLKYPNLKMNMLAALAINWGNTQIVANKMKIN